MKEMLLLTFYILLALLLLTFGAFIAYEGGAEGSGSAMMVRIFSVVVVIFLVVPKFARFIVSLADKHEVQRKQHIA
jgi:hypothetical protein